MENFTSMSFPSSQQVTEQVRSLISIIEDEHSSNELMSLLNLTHRENFRSNYLHKVIELGLVEFTIPNKPNSSKQKYKLSSKGRYIKCQ
ncbi:MAG: Fic family protein [Cyclobacteriaceae bacterium]